MARKYMDFAPRGGKPTVVMPRGVKKVARTETGVAKPATSGKTVVGRRVKTTAGQKIGARRKVADVMVRKPTSGQPQVKRVQKKPMSGQPQVKRVQQKPLVKRKVVKKAPSTGVGMHERVAAKNVAMGGVATGNVAGAKNVATGNVAGAALGVPQEMRRHRVNKVELDEVMETDFEPTTTRGDEDRLRGTGFSDLEILARQIESVAQSDEDVVTEVEEHFRLTKQPNYGAIENYQPKFINTEVEKRPLSGAARLRNTEMVGSEPMPMPMPMQPEETEVEPRRFKKSVGLRRSAGIRKALGAKDAQVTKEAQGVKMAQGAVATPGYGGNSASGVATGMSVSQFEDRAKEEKKSDKKNTKGSKLGMALAVLVTILLGAAAGTVAFLLLPR